jgi:hypothetical protein
LRVKSRKNIDLEDIKSKSSHSFAETSNRKRSDIQIWLGKNSLSALKLNMFDELRKSIDHKTADPKSNESVLQALRGTSAWNDVSLNFLLLYLILEPGNKKVNLQFFFYVLKVKHFLSSLFICL